MMMQWYSTVISPVNVNNLVLNKELHDKGAGREKTWHFYL